MEGGEGGTHHTHLQQTEGSTEKEMIPKEEGEEEGKEGDPTPEKEEVEVDTATVPTDELLLISLQQTNPFTT